MWLGFSLAGMRVFRFGVGEVHDAMDWLSLWIGELDIVRVEVWWPGLDRSVVEEVLNIFSWVPLWHSAIFLIGFPLSRVERYEVRLILRGGGYVAIRRDKDTIEILTPEEVKPEPPGHATKPN